MIDTLSAKAFGGPLDGKMLTGCGDALTLFEPRPMNILELDPSVLPVVLSGPVSFVVYRRYIVRKRESRRSVWLFSDIHDPHEDELEKMWSDGTPL